MGRIVEYMKGGTLAIHQNILSHHSDQVSEITVDEKEYSEKGKTQDTLS